MGPSDNVHPIRNFGVASHPFSQGERVGAENGAPPIDTMSEPLDVEGPSCSILISLFSANLSPAEVSAAPLNSKKGRAGRPPPMSGPT